MEWRSLVPELEVSDYEKSLEFYVSTLGFTAKYSRVNPSFAYLEREGSQIMIEELQEDSSLRDVLVHPFGRGINFQIECSDIATLRQRIRDAGIEVLVEVHDAHYDAAGVKIGQRQFVVADPDGYLLRFCQVLGNRKLDV